MLTCFYANVCTITAPAIAVAGPMSRGARFCSIHASPRLFDLRSRMVVEGADRRRMAAYMGSSFHPRGLLAVATAATMHHVQKGGEQRDSRLSNRTPSPRNETIECLAHVGPRQLLLRHFIYSEWWQFGAPDRMKPRTHTQLKFLVISSVS
jgi:hypothetical protein